MTTAHRPTWAPAVGGEEQGGMRIFVPSKMRSGKDQAAHTKMKFRQFGQSSQAELAGKDLRAELEEKEKKAAKKLGIDFEEERKKDLMLLQDSGAGDIEDAGLSKVPPRALVPKAMDADDEDEDAESSSSSDDDDDDDEEELLAELERIKKERAEEAAKKAAEEAAAQTKEKEQELRMGNPLLQSLAGGEASFSMKRRWDDDVVFKHQSRGEPKKAKRFINDTIRNDFHTRFLNKYIG